MKQNIFQAIGLADLEKVHSAVIGWMLSENCNAFNIKAKSELLCKIFGASVSTFNKINVIVEIHNLDILIVTEDDKSEKIYWVIENKIKSSQRKDQLKDYVDSLSKIAGSCNKMYCFLSLISEEPQCKKPKWQCTTYGQLAGYLDDALKYSKDGEKDYIMVSDYLECIKSLDKALKDFLGNPRSYPNVFTDGSKRKEDKEFENVNFIGKHTLETIFQKCYLKQILHGLEVELSAETIVNETRGTALIDYLSFIKLPCGLESHIQIQNGTFKVFLCMQNDKDCSKDVFLEKWFTLFDNLGKKYSSWHINKPKRKPSISLSISNKEWYMSSYTDIVKRWKELYVESKEIQNELVNEIQGISRKF